MDSATHYSEAGFSLLFRPTSSEPVFGCRGSPHLDVVARSILSSPTTHPRHQHETGFRA
jgi:hypothetical protein